MDTDLSKCSRRTGLTPLWNFVQIKALREGIDGVFSWKMLCVFSPAELQQKLCVLPWCFFSLASMQRFCCVCFLFEHMTIRRWSDLEWDESKLEKIVRPGPMWPQDKDQVPFLACLILPQRQQSATQCNTLHHTATHSPI